MLININLTMKVRNQEIRMDKKERTLTSAEQKRKTDFEKICEEMEQRGYLKRDLTVGVLQANMMAIVIMLPFAAVTFGTYLIMNPINRTEFSISIREILVFWTALLLLTVLHEIIHGLTWGIFAKGHRSAIAFGFIWKMLTPYCTCTEPLTKWQYIAGGAMPTLVLGFGSAVIAALTGNFWILVLSEAMIFSGGGDFFIILKMLLFKSANNDVLYYDHPYECGIVAFERK